MVYKLIYPESYLKRAKKFLRQHPEIHQQYQKTLQLLELNPHHPSLRLHGLSSVSINISYRLVLIMAIETNEITLVNVGTHDQVY